MSLQDRLHDLVEPLVAERDLELFDLTYAGGTLTVLVQRPDAGPPGEGVGAGIDIDAIATLSRAISRALDDADPISGTYSLEVSTPGLERPLRTPAHFAGATGEQVSIKTTAHFDGPRRVKGELVAASDHDITVRPDGDDEVTIPLEAIDKARTVFEWGAEPKGAKPRSKGTTAKAPKGATRSSADPSDPPRKPKPASKKVTSS